MYYFDSHRSVVLFPPLFLKLKKKKAQPLTALEENKPQAIPGLESSCVKVGHIVTSLGSCAG